MMDIFCNLIIHEPRNKNISISGDILYKIFIIFDDSYVYFSGLDGHLINLGHLCFAVKKLIPALTPNA